MKPELENELFRKYPKIFTDTLIGHKIKCNDGWFHLLDVLSYDLQSDCDIHPDIPQIRAVSVVNDHGDMKFISIGGNIYLWKIIQQAEERSRFTCEECGSLGQRVYINSYLQCLCPECQKRNGT